MAILVEQLTVVVRREAIERCIFGGWERFRALTEDHAPCSDGCLAGASFATALEVRRFIAILEGYGIRFEDDGTCQDIAVLDQCEGLWVPCAWLVLGRLPLDADELTVKAVWLDPKLVSTSNPLNYTSVAVPVEWTYAGSFSELDAQLTQRHAVAELIFQRCEPLEDVYLDPDTGCERRYPASTDPEVLHHRGQCLLKGEAGHALNPPHGMLWLEAAADLGHLSARHALGLVYSLGLHGIACDEVAAAHHYRLAAEAGFSPSQNNLADLYQHGRGVARSIPEAVYWATRSAEQGEAFAYTTLAELRATDSGFPHDDATLYQWLLLAVRDLPRGRTLKTMKEAAQALERRAATTDLARGRELAERWAPLKPTDQLMGELDSRKDVGMEDDETSTTTPTRTRSVVVRGDAALSTLRH